jgi:hypothetical protein
VALRRWREGLCAVAVPIILATAGCSGDGLARQPVAGFVYLDGRPLSDGLIIFYPVDTTKFAVVTNGGAMVKNGRFSLARSEGLVAGEYYVSISAPAPDYLRREETRGPERAKVVAKEVIPARYNSPTALRLELKDQAIKEVTFHLASK